MQIISPLVRYHKEVIPKSKLTIHKPSFSVEIPVTGIKNDGCIKKNVAKLIAKKEFEKLRNMGCKIGGGRLVS